MTGTRPSRVVAWVGGAALLAAAMAGVFWLARAQRADELMEWRARLTAMAADREIAILRWVEDGLGTARTVAADPETVGLVTGDGPPVGAGSDGELDIEVASHAHYLAGWLVHADGRVLDAAGATGRPSPPEMSLAREVMRDETALARIVTLDAGVTAVLFAAPVAGDRGAVLLRADPADFLHPLLRSEPVPTRTGETLLAQLAGDSVAFLTPLRNVDGASPTVRRSVDRPGLAMGAALEGEETFGEFEDYRGTPVLAATRRLEGTPWGLVTKVDRAEALAGYRREVAEVILLLVALGVALLAATSGYWIHRRAREQRVLTEELRESEARFRHLYDESLDAIFLTAPSGEIIDVNPACLELYRIPRGELHRYQAQDFYADPADRVEFRRRMAEEGGVTDFEIRMRKTDGEEFVALYSATARRDASGEVLGFQGIVRDITDRKEAEERLRESEERLRLTQENAPIGIALVGLDGDFLQINPALGAIVGYAPEELARLTFQDITHPDDLDEDLGYVQQLLDGEIEGYEMEKRYIHADGHVVWVHLTGSLVRTDDGEPLHFVAHVHDITERIRAREELATSERRFRSLIENASDLISILDAEGRIVYRSPAFERLLGYGPDELEGVDAFELVHPDDRDDLRRLFGELVEEPRATTVAEYRIRDTWGEWRTLESRGTSLLDDPAVGGLVINSRDVTDRRAMEAELREAEARLRTILDTITEAVVMVEAGGRITYANPAAEGILGISPSEFEGRAFDDPAWKITAADGGPFPTEELPFARVTATGAPVRDVRHGVERPDGTRTIVSVNAAPLRDAGGDVAGMVASVQDVTERTRAEREVARLNAELERRVRERTAELAAANQELEAFAYSVSHDLRQPLRALSGFSEALAEDYGDRLDGEALDFLERIRANAERMAQLIDDILKLSRVSRKELRRERVDLVPLARAVLDELRDAEPEREVLFRAPDELVAEADPQLVRVVLENLLGNAWKFTGEEDVAEIELGVEVSGGGRAYRVSDNGVGFDMAYSDKLFKAFHRLHRDSEFEGTGIGLATVQRIARRHGGDVRAESVPGEGATVWFDLGEER